MKKIIYHQATKLNWITPGQVEGPRTLVLGSFNPYNPNGNLVDYYYGRQSNHFWRSIANIIGEKDDYFFDMDNRLERKLSIMKGRFSCLDVIDFIEFSSEDEVVLDRYLKGKIFSNFADQNIWVTKTNSKGATINLSRNYNNGIIQTLKDSDTIRKVIHTMGVSRISPDGSYPREHSLDSAGFNGFISQIQRVCRVKGIEFVFPSFSPSDYAVKNGSTDKLELIDWLKKHLWL